MIKRFYLPVLKTKQGEFDALSVLNFNIKKYLIPLIEITKLEFDNAANVKPKTIEKHLDNVSKRIATKWGNSNAFIDPYLIYDTSPSGVSCFEYIYSRLASSGIIPMPVVQLTTPENIIENIKVIISKYQIKEIGIRVFISDIASPELSQNIRTSLQEFEVKAQNCHLILDLNNADFTNVEDFADSIIDCLSDFPLLKEWKSFSICGGSFPMTNRISVGENEIPRGEWRLFKKILQKQKGKTFERPLNFGDYGIVAPGHFEFDPLKMDRSANIRYTHNNLWYVVKGKSLKTSGHEQYYAIAKKISDSSYFFGKDFSEGDLHLKQCSMKRTTTGNPTVWNKIGFNHHFSKVVTDLFSS